MAGLTVACVLSVGEKCPYDTKYVEILRDSVERHLKEPYRFVCLSNVDVPCERVELKYGWPGWWAKLELFRPDIEAERILYFDLDTVITGDLSDISSQTKFTMIRGFRNNPTGKRRGSGLMMLTDREPVWNAWIKRPNTEAMRGDQDFIRPFCEQVWQDVVPDQVVSFKHDVNPIDRLPDNARVVCFHGKPRPHQLSESHWMRDYWR